MTLETVLIPLDQLRFGHEADPPINVRRTDKAAEVDELAASLKAHGMIEPLLVQYVGKVPFVANGDRRLAAQRLRVERDEIPEDEPQECRVVPEGADAHELSLVTAMSPVPAHPADCYQAFARVARDATQAGKDAVTEITARFGTTAKYVRQVLALGTLSPRVLDAWRANKIDLEGVRAFTLAKDEADQERVLKKLKGSAAAWEIKKELGVKRGDAQRYVAFIGRKAYENAGGVIREDLFGEDHVISDPAIAKMLADEKLNEKVAALIADGWGWAALESDLGNERYSLPTDHEVARKGAKTAKADRAKFGCTVGINYEGKLSVDYGKLKKGQNAKKVAAKKAAASGEPAEPALTNTLAIRMSEQVTRAAKTALMSDPRASLAALLAGLITRNGPVKVTSAGFEGDLSRASEHTFATSLAGFLKMGDAEVLEACARIVPETLDLRVYKAEVPFLSPDRAALLDGIRPPSGSASVSDCMRLAFDVEDYLKSAPRALKLRAVADISPGEGLRSAEKLKGADLAKRAIALATTGEGARWLPVELRTADYAGPGVAQVADLAKRAAKKTPAKKKVPAKRGKK